MGGKSRYIALHQIILRYEEICMIDDLAHVNIHTKISSEDATISIQSRVLRHVVFWIELGMTSYTSAHIQRVA